MLAFNFKWSALTFKRWLSEDIQARPYTIKNLKNSENPDVGATKAEYFIEPKLFQIVFSTWVGSTGSLLRSM
jgi:hypothetical protein